MVSPRALNTTSGSAKYCLGKTFVEKINNEPETKRNKKLFVYATALHMTTDHNFFM